MDEATSQKPLSLGQRLKHRVSVTLGRPLSDKHKRLILFSSLSAKFCGQTKFNNTTLHKLNQVMALSNRDDALDLPVKLSRVIWSGDRGDVVVYPTPETVKVSEDEIVAKIMSAIPEWLKYSNKKGMREDLARLIRYQDVITS